MAGYVYMLALRKRLVWYQHYDDIRDAISDEKRFKGWRRKWKLELVEAMNPGWDDLYDPESIGPCASSTGRSSFWTHSGYRTDVVCFTTG